MQLASRTSLWSGGAEPAPAYWGLCFTAEEAGSTVAMAKSATSGVPAVSLETSPDGVTWTPFVVGTTTITLANVRDKVFFRAGDGGTGGDGVNLTMGSGTSTVKYNYFVMTGRIAASGDTTSLLDRQASVESLGTDRARIPEGSTVAQLRNTFYNLFTGCAALTAAPALPSATLVAYCYYGMFKDCASLAVAPALPALEAEAYCYREMFKGCTALAVAQSELPAKVVKSGCYREMFKSCTSLTTAPALRNQSTVLTAFTQMFSGCTSLAYVEAGVFNSSRMTNWLQDVSPTGTIVMWDIYGDDLSVERGASAVPEGWHVVTKHLPYFAVRGASSLTYDDNTEWAELVRLQYTTDFGETWTDWTSGSLNTTGDALYMFATRAPRTKLVRYVNGTYYSVIQVRQRGATHVGGNICSLLSKDAESVSIESDYTFGHFFDGCTSLVSGLIDLSRVSIAGSYNAFKCLFTGCTSLISAPTLPFLELAHNCYQELFRDCTSLAKIELSATSWNAPAYPAAFTNWLSGVAATGTFKCPAALGTNETIERGASRCPEGWTVINI